MFTGAVSKIMRLNSLRKNCLQCLASENGISWEYVPVLEHIKRFPGCMQADISKKLKVTAAAVTQSTQKLENAKLIEKKTDPCNLRIKKLYITQNGIDFLNRGSQVFDEVDEMMFDGFLESEIKVLEGMLERINTNLSEYKNDIDTKQLFWELKRK